LYFKGTVATEAEKNEIWKAIKTIPKPFAAANGPLCPQLRLAQGEVM
jgi:hypothetical protein